MIKVGDKIIIDPDWKDNDNWAAEYKKNLMTVYDIVYVNGLKCYAVNENHIKWYYKHIIKVKNDFLTEEEFMI